MNDQLLYLLQQALLLAAILSAPPIAAAWVTQIVVAAIQRGLKIPEASGVAHGPQVAAVAVVVAACAPWSAAQLVAFAEQVFTIFGGAP